MTCQKNDFSYFHKRKKKKERKNTKKRDSRAHKNISSSALFETVCNKLYLEHLK